MTALIAVVMAASVLLVPGTAHADATDVSLIADFDNLSADRIARYTLKAKSESGVTDVQATLKKRVDRTWVEFGTLPFAHVDGTVNDGTWNAEYKTDIKNHPGVIGLDVVIKTADGGTLTKSTSIFNCYRSEIADLTTTPETVDYDNRGIVIRGRILIQKTREAGLEPAPDAVVWGSGGEVTARTAADGTFELAVPTPTTLVHVPGATWVCSATADAPEPETVVQWTEMTARIVTPQPVQAGTPVTVEGRLQRHAADGLRPVGDKWLWLDARVGGTPVYLADPVRTAADGTFRLEFAAEQAGLLILAWEGDTYLSQTQEAAGELTLAQAARITDLSFPGEPAPYGETMRATGRLLVDGSPVGGGRMQLEYAPREGWEFTVAASGRTAADGTFSLGVRATESGYWRVRHLDGADRTSAISDIVHVDVKYKMQLNGLSVKPAGTGGVVTAQGSLVRYADAPEPADRERIDVYFMPKGGSTWKHQGAVYTGADGKFNATFTATGDGYWTAASWEDSDHLGSNAPIVYADVSVSYASKITDFSATPKTVAAGGTITVRGRLTRLSGGGTAAPLPNKPIYLYSMRGVEWQEAAVVRTNSDGWFEKTFTAEESRYWTAWFWGDGDHARSNSSVVHVEVQ
ncbi:hypothetical protein BJF79_36310 [Actinomadura sp. CNU-125]|nr:hypothetical protein BJF79_36310 [Actinomadura sp. CNU-125]